MIIEDLSNAYGRVARAHGLPKMVPARCRIETRHFEDAASALAAWQSFQSREGWLQFQSHVTIFERSEPPQPSDDWGVLLAAESVDADGRSMSLRHTGGDGWVSVLCTPLDDTATPSVDDLVIADLCSILGTGKTPGKLRYRRYWSLDPDTGAAPAFAAFLGFDRTEIR